jgi:thiol-disulfide isomerase/thioredoxin
MMRRTLTTAAWILTAVAGTAGGAFAQSAAPAPAAAPAPEAAPAAAPEPAPAEPAPAEAGPTLVLGDKAPALSIAKWVKGSAVEKFEAGKVYVVEFWATWCPPCRASIPHLTDLQKKYQDRGLTVIGISSQEQRGLDDVEKFVKDMGAKMDYVVAWDDAEKTFADWHAAAGQQGIPAAFIVDQSGRIAWMGHPMQMDRPLEQIVEKTWDLDREVSLAKRRVEVGKKTEPLLKDLQELLEKPDMPGALAQLDKIIAIDPEINSDFGMYRFQVMVERAKDLPAAYAYLDEAIGTTLKNNGEALNVIAWAIAENPLFEGNRDFARAEKAAARASELAGGTDPNILDTLGRIAFQKGDLATAIKHQEKAVELVKDPELKADLETRLEQYRTFKPAG